MTIIGHVQLKENWSYRIASTSNQTIRYPFVFYLSIQSCLSLSRGQLNPQVLLPAAYRQITVNARNTYTF
jgi:hypothetical protein